MAATNRIAELSSLIAKETALVSEFLANNQLPTPSLNENASPSIPIPDSAERIKAARLTIIESCSELQALMTGPKELLKFKVHISRK